MSLVQAKSKGATELAQLRASSSRLYTRNTYSGEDFALAGAASIIIRYRGNQEADDHCLKVIFARRGVLGDSGSW